MTKTMLCFFFAYLISTFSENRTFSVTGEKLHPLQKEIDAQINERQERLFFCQVTMLIDSVPPNALAIRSRVETEGLAMPRSILERSD